MKLLPFRSSGRNRSIISYSDLIGGFFDAQVLAEISGGLPAFDAKPSDEGVVRTGSTLEAFFSRVDVPELDARSTRFAPSPYLWVYVAGDDQRLDSFVVEVEMILAALKMAPPELADHRRPITAYTATDPGVGTVKAGAVLYLSLSVVEVERRNPNKGGAGWGIYFELSRDERGPPLCGFAMEGLTLLLALAVVTFTEPLVSEGPTGLAEEMQALSEELGASTNPKRQANRADPTEE